MQIEVTFRTGGAVADEWESEPNLRAEIKMKIAEAMARALRTNDLIEWDTAKTADGDFVVRGFLNAEPGTEKMVQHTVDLNPVTEGLSHGRTDRNFMGRRHVQPLDWLHESFASLRSLLRGKRQRAPQVG